MYAYNCFLNDGLRKFSILRKTIVYDEIIGLMRFFEKFFGFFVENGGRLRYEGERFQKRSQDNPIINPDNCFNSDNSY